MMQAGRFFSACVDLALKNFNIMSAFWYNK